MSAHLLFFIFHPLQKHFYGPNQRWLPHWMGALRLGTYINGYNTHRAGVKGNLGVGEGRLLGGWGVLSKTTRYSRSIPDCEREIGLAPSGEGMGRRRQHRRGPGGHPQVQVDRLLAFCTNSCN